VYANGDIFRGSFSDNKKNGAGVYENKAKQEVYQGSWVMDIKNGKFNETKKKENVNITGHYQNG
jgi:hypothetical protein